MKKAYRIKSDKDFQRVYHQGRSVANRQLVLYTYHTHHQPHFRVGLSVGKRLGNAVKRNQIKRYLRQAVRELSPRIDPTVEFLLIARAGVVDFTASEVTRSMEHVMTLAGILDTDRVED